MSAQPGTAPYVLENKGTFDAPYTLPVPASLEIRPDTATAVFDGTGASGQFLACLTFYGSDGERLCRMYNPNPVPMGGVAEVTYIPPFGSAATSATTSSGIQFDTEPQSGTWFDLETTGTDANGYGMHQDAGNHNIFLEGGNHGGSVLVSPSVQLLGGAAGGGGNRAEFDVGAGSTDDIYAKGHNLRVALLTGGDGFAVFHGTTATKIVQARNAGGQDQIGFFNVGPVARPTAAGSRGGNAALASLLTGLASLGLIIDGTTP